MRDKVISHEAKLNYVRFANFTQILTLLTLSVSLTMTECLLKESSILAAEPLKSPSFVSLNFLLNWLYLFLFCKSLCFLWFLSTSQNILKGEDFNENESLFTEVTGYKLLVSWDGFWLVPQGMRVTTYSGYWILKLLSLA